MVLVIGITMFLMMGVVPTFKTVFESLDTDLPAITQMVLDLSNFLRANAVLAIGGMFTAIAGVALFAKTRTGERFFDHLLLRLPVFGVLFRSPRAFRTFMTLVRSGVPIMAILDIVATSQLSSPRRCSPRVTAFAATCSPSSRTRRSSRRWSPG